MNNEGNFRKILCYRAQGDSNLRSYLRGTDKIKYSSATRQNTIIGVYKNILINKIVSKVKSSNYVLSTLKKQLMYNKQIKCFCVLGMLI